MPPQRPPLRLVALGKVRRRDRGLRFASMKPDRPSVLRSVLPAAKIRDPLTKLGGDRPYGRQNVHSYARRPGAPADPRGNRRPEASSISWRQDGYPAGVGTANRSIGGGSGPSRSKCETFAMQRYRGRSSIACLTRTINGSPITSAIWTS